MAKFAAQVDFLNIPMKGTALQADTSLPLDPIPGRITVLAEMVNAYQIIYTLHFYNGQEWKKLA